LSHALAIEITTAQIVLCHGVVLLSGFAEMFAIPLVAWWAHDAGL
jgi:hypothetical protein